MKALPVFALTTIGIVTLGLTANIGHATPDQRTSAPRKVQIKLEWVRSATAPDMNKFVTDTWNKSLKFIEPDPVTPTSIKSLTLDTTTDQTSAVDFQPGTPSEDAESITTNAHINSDQSILVHLLILSTKADTSREAITSTQTYKPGKRLILGGMTNGAGSETLYMTVSLVKSPDDPFAIPVDFRGPVPSPATSR